jgi:hypothetical protein
MDGFNPDSIQEAAREAANAPTRFNATERSAMIRAHVSQIRRMVQEGKTVDQIKMVFPEFAKEYPNLLEMLTRPGGFDERSLSMMILMLDRMGSGNLSQHEASIKVGQHLLNRFVTPQINPTTGSGPAQGR